jgi:sulfatase maturation enzyme AslB (radical SAM superfamily)
MDKLDQLRREIIDSETFCFYPFLEISTNPGGHLKPCCYYNSPLYHSDKKVISIFNGDSFDSAWNSHDMIELRKSLHQGTMPPACSVCERDGPASMRARSVQEYKNNINTLTLVQNTISNNYTAPHTPTILELKPSNLCNLKCVMCNSYDSSQIAKEIKELSKKFGGITVSTGRFIEISSAPGITENNSAWHDVDQPNWEDHEVIWQNFERIVPYLEVLSFAGGEPTLMPFVMKALNYCVDNDYAKDITVFISSNFTNLNKNFFKLMPEYRKFELIASIDGYDRVNDYARFPSKWSQISKNYVEAKKYMQYNNVKLLTNITVSVLNIVDLVDLLNWIEERADEHPYFKEWPYNINLISSPPDQHISLLADDLKELAVSRLESYLRSSKILQEFPGLDSKIHLLINELRKPGDNRLFDKFKERIKVLDAHREINIQDYIPSIGSAFYE